MAAAIENEKAIETFDEQEYQAHMNELESVKTEQEMDEKISGMTRLGMSVSYWMKKLFNNDIDGKPFNAVWCSIDEYKKNAEASLRDVWTVLNLPNWKEEKRGAIKGDIVESIITERFGKVYRFTGIVNCPAKFIFEELKNHPDKYPEWNPTMLKSEVIKVISDAVDLTYQVTAGGGRGIISPRDFVTLRNCSAVRNDGTTCNTDNDVYAYICTGVSVEVPGYPPTKDMVRAQNKVGGWCMKPISVKSSSGKIEQMTKFQWLMCCDLKGKIPQFVLDTAFSTAMLDYIVYVRKFAAESKAKGLF